MNQAHRFSLLGVPVLALLLAGCGGGGSCLLGDALCNDKTPANVAPANLAPVARASSPQSVLLGQEVTLDGSASSDANGDNLSYAWTWVSKPVGSVAQLDATDSARVRFTVDVPGVYAATLLVRDGKLSSEPVMAVVSGFEQNAPPVAAAGADQSVLTGAVVSLDGSTSSDANRDRLKYKWTLTSRPAGSTAQLLKSDEVKASFTADLPGVYAASLVVNDGKLSSETAVVLIQVSNVNAAPVAVTGPAQTVVKGDVVTLDGTGSTDVNNDRLTHKWQLIAAPAGSTAKLSDEASARPTFKADVSGVYVAGLIVSDGKVFSQPTSVAVTAVDANAPPVANAGLNQNVLVGSVVKIDGLASFDPNRDELQYKWTMISAPSGSAADVAPKNLVRTSFTADVPGVYVVGLTVNDKQLFSEMVAVSITATNGNAAPTAQAGSSQSVLRGSVVNLDGSGSTDPNGDLLNYHWTLVSAPVGSTASLSNRAVAKPSFTANVSGVYVLSLVVSDAQLSSVPSLMSVTASAANVPPVANAGPEQTVRVGNMVMLDGSGSTDANGDVLSYSWNWTTNPGNAVLTGRQTATPSFFPMVAGIYVLTLTVDDLKGGTHLSRVLINVE